MSEDEELRKLREQRMQELRKQQAQKNKEMADQQRAAMEAKKKMLLRRILSSPARSRLGNIRLARPQYAQQIEVQLIQAYQAGNLRGNTPLSDKQFKNLLKQLHNRSHKRERKIKFR